jgi:protein SCO1/2
MTTITKTVKTLFGLIFALTSALALAQAGEALPYYNSADFTPHWYKSNDEKLLDFHRIPAFSFTDQAGNRVSDRTLQDKIYIASFFFSTCPGICPTVQSKLSRVQVHFVGDPDVKIVQHSITPSVDTVETLSAYAKKNQIDNSIWHLLTGDRDDIYELAKSAYFASEDLGKIQGTDDFLHTENLLLIDQNKHIRGIYNGLNNVSIDYLIADIEALKTERSDKMACH